MKSKSTLYELILTPSQTCKFPQMPTGDMLEKALPQCQCSDLFAAGFSYKPLDLGAGVIAQDDAQYRLLKRLKSARFIHDSLRLLPAETLLQRLSNGIVQIQDGYIGYNQEAGLAIKTVRLPEGDSLFGVELRAGSLFRCFVKTETPTFPACISLGECLMEVRQALPVESTQNNTGVLQQNLPLAENWQIADTASRFKLSYDTHNCCKVLCAGSIISRKDYFGNGIII